MFSTDFASFSVLLFPSIDIFFFSSSNDPYSYGQFPYTDP